MLEAEGWKVILTSMPQGFRKKKDGGNDFFSLFDLIAIKDKSIRFIQVKTSKDSTGTKWKKEAKYFTQILLSSVEIWIFKDRQKLPRIKLVK